MQICCNTVVLKKEMIQIYLDNLCGEYIFVTRQGWYGIIAANDSESIGKTFFLVFMSSYVCALFLLSAQLWVLMLKLHSSKNYQQYKRFSAGKF